MIVGMDADTLIAKLKEDRGSYPAISRATGIKYATLTKIAAGQVKRPYGRTLKALDAYYNKAQA